MENSENTALQPRVLLSWPISPDYVPPPVFSSQQVTLCPRGGAKGFVEFSSVCQDLIKCPEEEYDIYDFIQKSSRIENKRFDLLIVRASSCEPSIPINTKKLKCPTVLLAGTTHQERFPISYLLAYCATEDFDYIVTPINRHHLHWFAAAGFSNTAWLPLIHMHTVTHEWVETREDKVAFLGHAGSFHPRRVRLLNTLKEAGLPLVAKSGTREEGARLFAHSLVSFNCSLNGDFNLRNLEIISAGGFLLTDRLSFASGFDEYLTPGLYCDVYDSESELVEKVKFYLENPELATEIARRAYEKFFTDWHPRYRVADLMNWVFKGELPEFYAGNSDPRFFISTSNNDLMDTRLAIYESVQELHRVEERLKILVSKECPVAIVSDLLDLPRLEVYAEAGFPVSELPKTDRVTSRVHVFKEGHNYSNGNIWDVLIVNSSSDLISQLLPHSKFAFVLGDQNQIVFSNATRLVNIETIYYSLSRADGSSCRVEIRFYKEGEDSTRYTFDEIFRKQSYPFLDFVDDVSLIVDVGANIGIASTYFRALYPNAKIVCFEPDPLAFHLLKLNSVTIGNCNLYPFGLYSDDIDKVFYSSLITPSHSSVYKNRDTAFPRIVRFVKASSFLKSIGIAKIDILKIDTEGCETQILKDLFEMLADVKIIYLEFHSEEDRRIIDQILSTTHVLCRGNIFDAHRGTLCYLNKKNILHNPLIEPLR
ncbi:FkbM family methyltransferase [Synechococcus sp. H70.2]|uniref:FkbM family methyltransferase n=1 Tax=unclassified Synechococcus TaxID=2626047 RepID=UPI0039C2B3A0